MDFKKTIAAYSARSGEFQIVDVPHLQYLMVDGSGDPNTSDSYTNALGALFPIAYTLKFASKQQQEKDYVVMPLEALWWAEDMDSFTVERDKSRWHWTVMIMVPDWIDHGMVEEAVGTIGKKCTSAKKPIPSRLEDVRLSDLSEGQSVQTLHLGPYDDEAGILAKMHEEFIPRSGLRMTGQHHEIYLNDVRRTEPSKLRTILRQPVVAAGEYVSTEG
ncbi:GyrI-like domain-containing protein [Rhodococcus sp. G-MC3]|uniref:GyrI-like domain-containing protein n=1 Tax=Rhodococcus sp. G-MC3 TaxID=3046209 RepID=UPI0024BB8ABB|nr:GyrI-like domain-containing protein [Rhodococcus sp. G-MC3]MDJ0394159.1 GyrI-like domain-containing protein [Rhodococcus sp. G-MC3]